MKVAIRKSLQAHLFDEATGEWLCVAANDAVAKRIVAALERPDPTPLISTLAQIRDINLSEDNCASFEVANARLRNVAGQALRQYHNQE